MPLNRLILPCLIISLNFCEIKATKGAESQMKLYTLKGQQIRTREEAKKLILSNAKKLSSPCYVDVQSSNGYFEYYVEESNIVGAKTLIIERKYIKASE